MAYDLPGGGTVISEIQGESPFADPLSVDGTQYPGTGRLYIKGSVRAGGEQNFAHFEVVSTEVGGTLKFRLSTCDGVVPAAAQAAVFDDAKGGQELSSQQAPISKDDYSDLSTQEMVTALSTAPMPGEAETIGLPCVPVSITVLDDGTAHPPSYGPGRTVRKFMASEVGPNQWGAFKFDDEALLDQGRIREPLWISHVVVEWVD